MSKDFDINDPEFWRSIDWDETGPVIKSDRSVNKSNANRARWKNPENRKQQSESSKSRWSNPDQREQASKRMTAYRETNMRQLDDNTKTKMSNRMKTLWKDNEFRKNMSEAYKKRTQKPRTQSQIDGSTKAGEKTRRIVITPKGKIVGLYIAAKTYNLSIASFQCRMRQKPHLYYYESDGPGEPTYEYVYYSEYATGPQSREFPPSRHYELALAAKCSVAISVAGKLKASAKWWEIMKKQNPDKYFVVSEPKREWNEDEHAPLSQKKKR